MTSSQLGAILVEMGRRNEALPLLEEAYARLLEEVYARLLEEVYARLLKVKGAHAPETRFSERALGRARDPG